AQQDPPADVLLEMTEADAALGVPVAAEPARVQHALGAAAVVVVEAPVQSLQAAALAERVTGHAGMTDLTVVADQPAVQLEADAVEAGARHVAADVEIVRPHAEAGVLAEQVVEAVRQGAAGCIDGLESHRRAGRVQLAG